MCVRCSMVAAKPGHCQVFLLHQRLLPGWNSCKEPERDKRRWEGESNDAGDKSKSLWLYACVYRWNRFALMEKNHCNFKIPMICRKVWSKSITFFYLLPSQPGASNRFGFWRWGGEGLGGCFVLFFRIVVWDEKKFFFHKKFLAAWQYLL